MRGAAASVASEQPAERKTEARRPVATRAGATSAGGPSDDAVLLFPCMGDKLAGMLGECTGPAAQP